MGLGAAWRRFFSSFDAERAARRQAKRIRAAGINRSVARANPHQDMGAVTGRPERPPERYEGRR